MKITQYYLAAILMLLSVYQAFSQTQTCPWYVLNDSGYLINARGADSDREGNFYVTGDYKGDALFKSAGEAGDAQHHYVSEHQQKPFLVKYDATGSLQYVLEILNRSGSNHYAVTVKALSGGELAWIVRVAGTYSFIDGKGEEHTFTASDQSVLILLSEKGELISQTALPLDYCREVFELSDKELLLFGTGQRERKNVMHLLNRETMQITPYYSAMNDLWTVNVSGGKVYMLKLEQQREMYKPTTAKISVYTSGMGISPVLLFSKDYAGHGLGQLYLMPENNSISLITTMILREGNSFTLDELSTSTSEDKMMLFRFDEEGELTSDISLKTRINGHYNTTLKPAGDGGYYLLSPVMDSLIIPRHDTLIRVPAHSQFIHELTLIKLGKNLDFAWEYQLGGTASNYHQSFIVPDKNGVYFATDLLDFVTLNGKYVELKWRAGLLLGRIGGTGE